MKFTLLKKIVIAIACSLSLTWATSMARPCLLESLSNKISGSTTSGNSTTGTVIEKIYNDAYRRMDGYIKNGTIGNAISAHAKDIKNLLYERASTEQELLNNVSSAIIENGNKLIGTGNPVWYKRFFHFCTFYYWYVDPKINTLDKQPIFSRLGSLLNPSIVQGNSAIDALVKKIETIQGTIVSKDLISKALEQYKTNVTGTYYFVKNNWTVLSTIINHGGPQNTMETTIANSLIDLVQKSETELKEAINLASGKTLTHEEFNTLFPQVSFDKGLISQMHAQLQPNGMWQSIKNTICSGWSSLYNHMFHPILTWKSWHAAYPNGTLIATTFAGLFSIFATYKIYQLNKSQRGGRSPQFKTLKTILYGIGLALAVPVVIGASGAQVS